MEATRGRHVAGGSGLHGPDSCWGEPRPAALPAQHCPSALGSEVQRALSRAGLRQSSEGTEVAPIPSPHYSPTPKLHTQSPNLILPSPHLQHPVPTCPSFHTKRLHSSGKTHILTGLKPLSQRRVAFPTLRKNKAHTGPICFPLK